MSHLEESAFQLSRKEMKEIKYLEMVKQRKTDNKQGKKLFSTKLSMEAQLAMVMALEDAENKPKEADTQIVSEEKCPTHKLGTDCKLEAFSKISSNATSKSSASSSQMKSFAELYRENGAIRMKNDITDETFKPEKLKKRPLDPYAKLESAMEIVETVKYDMDDSSSDDDNEFIDQIAQQNSVDKCNIWISANSQQQENVSKISGLNSWYLFNSIN